MKAKQESRQPRLSVSMRYFALTPPLCRRCPARQRGYTSPNNGIPCPFRTRWRYAAAAASPAAGTGSPRRNSRWSAECAWRGSHAGYCFRAALPLQAAARKSRNSRRLRFRVAYGFDTHFNNVASSAKSRARNRFESGSSLPNMTPLTPSSSATRTFSALLSMKIHSAGLAPVLSRARV